MKIAVTYEAGQIFQHFGHTGAFKVYDVKDGEVVKSEVVDTNGSGHGALAGMLLEAGVDVLICGGIGGGAVNALNMVGIEIYAGNSGDCDEAVENLLAGNLDKNAEEGHGKTPTSIVASAKLKKNTARKSEIVLGLDEEAIHIFDRATKVSIRK